MKLKKVIKKRLLKVILYVRNMIDWYMNELIELLEEK